MAASFAAAIAGCGRAWPVQYRRFERETDRSSLADAFDGSLAELTTAIPKRDTLRALHGARLRRA